MRLRYWRYVLGVLSFVAAVVIAGTLSAIFTFLAAYASGRLDDTGTVSNATWIALFTPAALLTLGIAYLCSRGFFLPTPQSRRAERISEMEGRRRVDTPHGSITEGWVPVAPAVEARVRCEEWNWRDRIIGRQDKEEYEAIVGERIAGLVPLVFGFDDGIFSLGCEEGTISVAEVRMTKTQSVLIIGFVPIPTGETARSVKITEWSFPSTTPCRLAEAGCGRRPAVLLLTFGWGEKEVTFTLAAPVLDATGKVSVDEVAAFLAE